MTRQPQPAQSAGVASIVRDALVAIGPRRRMLAVLVALSLVTGVLETALLYLVGRLALAVSTGHDNLDIAVGGISLSPSLRAVALTAAAVVALLLVLAYPTAAVAARLSSATLNRARDRLVSTYLATSWTQRSSQREGQLQELIGQYAIRAERVVTQLSTIVVVGLSIAILALGAVIVSPAATGLGLVGFAVLSAVTRPAASRVKRWSAQTAARNRELASQVAQTARLAQETLAFGVAAEVERDLRRTIRQVSRTVARMRLVSRLTPNLYLYGAFALVVGILIAFVSTDTTNVTSLGPLMLLFIRGLGYGKQLQAATQTGLENSPYIAVLEAEIAELASTPVDPGSVDLDRLAPIAFRDVSFSYTPGHPVLSDATFSIEPGSVLGVVGPSGGGKTTCTQLLLRLRAPTSGRITVGDVDLGDVTPASWARLVALVPQDNKLIRASVADNIRFYRPGWSDDEVAEAARLAHLHDEIAALPQGYQTTVGPGARSLSGGQCQRLGLARALLGQPAMLVLDEPTSALDARSENLIRDTLVSLRGRTTLVIVAHRPATLEICDSVLRIERGRVAVGAVDLPGRPAPAAP